MIAIAPLRPAQAEDFIDGREPIADGRAHGLLLRQSLSQTNELGALVSLSGRDQGALLIGKRPDEDQGRVCIQGEAISVRFLAEGLAQELREDSICYSLVDDRLLGLTIEVRGFDMADFAFVYATEPGTGGQSGVVLVESAELAIATNELMSCASAAVKEHRSNQLSLFESAA
jgi:hypothetical protein